MLDSLIADVKSSQQFQKGKEDTKTLSKEETDHLNQSIHEGEEMAMDIGEEKKKEPILNLNPNPDVSAKLSGLVQRIGGDLPPEEERELENGAVSNDADDDSDDD